MTLTVFAGNASTVMQVTPEEDILAIDDEIKAYLDETIRPIRLKEEKAVRLHEVLFTPEGRNIQYDGSVTKTAQQTFESGYGNCVSLANLYVAAARYVGLKAKFQKVKVPRSWERSGEFYILPGHMNVTVRINSTTNAVVELVSTYFPQDLEDQVISDKQAYAEYYSNLGVEFLEKQDFPTAITYLETANQIYPNLAFTWSNLGVAYKFNGDYDKAEQAYTQALDVDKNYLSALKNLYILYFLLDEKEKIASLSKRVKKYSRKNPYFLAKTGDILYDQGDYEAAVSLYKKAIAKKKNESEFHFHLAKAYFRLGDLEKANRAQKKAVDFALTESDRDRFQAKLEAIQRHIVIR